MRLSVAVGVAAAVIIAVAGVVRLDVLRYLNADSNTNNNEDDDREEEAYPTLLAVAERADFSLVEVNTTAEITLIFQR